jgi:iron complex outermembrane receptor protein
MPSSPARSALRAFVLLFLAVRPAWAAPHPPSAEATPPVTGVVQDSAGVPLPNVQVAITAINRVTTTNHQGRFTFLNLPSGTHHLDAHFIGYAPGHAVVTVPAAGDTVHVTIVMRSTPLRLSGVQVTATPAGSEALDLTQSTVALAGKELARSLGPSVAQTLSNEPGIAMRYAGPAATMPVIRGLSGERILVLQDGERAGDLSATSPDHGLSVDPLSASRIEVVRGPASLLYGNNALGGVVNVISGDIPTTVPSHAEGYVAGQAESVNPGGAISGGVTYPLGTSLAVTLRGGGRDINDVRIGGGDRLANTYARNWNAAAGIGLVRERLTGALAWRGFGFEYGLPSAPGAGEAGIHLEGSRQQGSVHADLALESPWLSRVKLDGSVQRYAHDEVESDGEVGTTFTLETQTAALTGRTRLGRVSGAVGLSGLFRQYAAAGEEALTPGANSNTGGLFVYQDIPLTGADSGERSPRLQLGARYDVYRVETKPGDPKFGAARSRDFGNVSGSVGLNVPLGPAASLGVSLARAFRAPTVEELYSNAFHAAAGSYDVGNPDLEPETNQGVDAVLRVASGGVSAQAAAYWNRVRNYIAPDIVGDTVTDEGETVPLNVFSQADATLRGLEAQLESEVARHVVLGVMGDVVRGRFRGGSAIPFMPAARVGGSARWDDGRWSLGAEARRTFRQDRVAENETRAGAFTMLNLNAGLTMILGARVHAFTLRADNVLDERYREATSRIKDFAFNPGRNVSLVYRLLF